MPQLEAWEIGDRGGFQLCRYETGAIDRLPLRLALGVLRVTGLSPRLICPEHALDLAAIATQIGEPARVGDEFTRG